MAEGNRFALGDEVVEDVGEVDELMVRVVLELLRVQHDLRRRLGIGVGADGIREIVALDEVLADAEALRMQSQEVDHLVEAAALDLVDVGQAHVQEVRAVPLRARVRHERAEQLEVGALLELLDQLRLPLRVLETELAPVQRQAVLRVDLALDDETLDHQGHALDGEGEVAVRHSLGRAAHDGLGGDKVAGCNSDESFCDCVDR